MKTIVCGVDSSPGGRAALRVAASLADDFGVRLVAVHVLDRFAASGEIAKQVAVRLLLDEAAGNSNAEARGEVGHVPERLAAVARDEAATMIVLGSRSRGRSRTFLRARCAAELAELTDVAVMVAPCSGQQTPVVARDHWRPLTAGKEKAPHLARQPARTRS